MCADKYPSIYILSPNEEAIVYISNLGSWNNCEMTPPEGVREIGNSIVDRDLRQNKVTK